MSAYWPSLIGGMLRGRAAGALRLRDGRIAGISAQQVDQCMAPNKAEDDRINQVASDGQSRYSIMSTPTFIVNGVSQGQFDFTTLPQVLDKELAKK